MLPKSLETFMGPSAELTWVSTQGKTLTFSYFETKHFGSKSRTIPSMNIVAIWGQIRRQILLNFADGNEV